MTLTVLGISHHTAPVEVRERFAYGEGEARRLLARLRHEVDVAEAVLLSTCNRTELYLHGEGAPGKVDRAEQVLREAAGVFVEAEAPHFYRWAGEEAVRHLFRVAAGLDSMVLGEAEIQGQVREAYDLARGAAASPPLTGPVLNRLFQTALSVGGRVRDETLLGEGAASVASVSVDLARKIFGPLAGRRVLVVGAGSTSELVVRSLHRAGVRDVTVTNRTFERAAELARLLGGRALPFEAMAPALQGSDIVVASTAAPQPVVEVSRVREAFPEGPRRPLLIVDIALPRDVEAAVGREPNVFLYNIDDLQRIVTENLGRRREAVPDAERIVAEHVAEFRAWHASLNAVPVIRSLRARAEAVRAAELARLLEGMDPAPEDVARLEQFSRRLLNKLLHEPTVRLREGAANGRGQDLVEAVRFLYDLESGDDTAKRGP